MTKKELQALHSEKAQITEHSPNLRGLGPEQRFVVSFSLTAMELAALRDLTNNPESAYEADVAAFLHNALYRAGLKL